MKSSSSFLKDGEALRHRVTRDDLKNLPNEKEKLRILTLNTWTDPHLLPERMGAVCKTIKKEQCDIVVLQEVFSSGAHDTLEKELSAEYHIYRADHRTADLQVSWWGSLVPAALSFVLSALADAAGHGWLATLFTVLAALLIPWLFIRVVEATFLRQLHQKAFGTPARYWDWMALVVLLRKEKFLEGELEVRRPFAKPAYPYPTSLQGLPFYWFQMSFLRPGFMVLECRGKSQDVTVAACHCVIGDYQNTANPGRKIQVEGLLFELNNAAPDGNFAVLAGDFNAGSDQPELSLLRELGWVDAVEAHCASHHGGDSTAFRTWEAKNPYTRLTVPTEPDDRIDYCFLKLPPAGSSNQVTIQTAKLIGNKEPFLSDHYGVLVEVEAEVSGGGALRGGGGGKRAPSRNKSS